MPFTPLEYTIERAKKWQGRYLDASTKQASFIYSDPTPVEKYDVASRASSSKVSLGEKFGPSWSTHYFELRVTIPSVLLPSALDEYHLLWNSSSEALLMTPSLEPLQGFSGDGGDAMRVSYRLPADRCIPGSVLTFLVLMSCNGLFGCGPDCIGPADPSREFELKAAELLLEVLESTSVSKERRARARLSMDHFLDGIAPSDPSSYANCLLHLNQFFGLSGAPIRDSSVVCIFPAARLWPFEETIQKVIRTYSNVVELMKSNHEFHFVASQMLHLSWLETHAPSLFLDVKSLIQSGRIVVEGGLWVEMDANLPSGESFCRQILTGQRYMQSRFGRRCDVFWLPDTFGYSSQLPQLIRQGGMKYFLTQKLSWNSFNHFPYNTFYWEGLDGTRVLTHFPPAESYCCQATVGEVLKSLENNSENGIAPESLLLYGYGDGGGGPDRVMLDRLDRLSDVDGLPRVQHSVPLSFFNSIRTTSAQYPDWKGELYLEMHQGTLTSQAMGKRRNKECESLLRDIELVSTILWRKYRVAYPAETLSDLWKSVLQCQFHDVLPGSSIELAREMYDVVLSKAIPMIDSQYSSIASPTADTLYLNAQESAWTGFLDASDLSTVYSLPALTVGVPTPVECSGEIVLHSSSPIQLETPFFIIHIHSDGTLTSLYDKIHDVELAESPLNQLKLYDDKPFFWDAWDIPPHYRSSGVKTIAASQVDIVEISAHRVKVGIVYSSLGSSSVMTEELTIDSFSPVLKFSCHVDWHEESQLLKVEFPFSVHALEATYGAPFGCLRRPTHTNTSWDKAKFEVCGHDWMCLQERGYTTGVLTGYKYGMGASDGHTLHLSLLRAPKRPDDTCDMGEHFFSYGLCCYPSDDLKPLIESACLFSNPPRRIREGLGVAETLLELHSRGGCIPKVSCLKRSEDGAGSVLRVAEVGGGRGTVTVSVADMQWRAAYLSNILEERLRKFPLSGDSLVFQLTPFQVATFYLV